MLTVPLRSKAFFIFRTVWTISAVSQSKNIHGDRLEKRRTSQLRRIRLKVISFAPSAPIQDQLEHTRALGTLLDVRYALDMVRVRLSIVENRFALIR